MLKSIGWSVLFSHLHSVCFYMQSPAHGKDALWESLSSFLFLSFSPSPKKFRLGLYCCRHDFSDFLFVPSLVGGIRSSWVGSDDLSAPVLE